MKVVSEMATRKKSPAEKKASVKRKTAPNKKPPKKGERKMDKKPDLILQHDENGRPLWKVGISKTSERGNVLKFSVVNVGEAPAVQTEEKPTRVQLTYGHYATHEDFIKTDITNLPHTVEFTLPKNEFYDPDCEFEITIDTNKNLDESNRDNNFASGVLRKDEPPYLMEPSNNNPSMPDGGKISVYVQPLDNNLPDKWKPKVNFKLKEKPITGTMHDKPVDALEFQVPTEFINKPYTIEIELVPTPRGTSNPGQKSDRQAHGKY